MPCEPNNCRRLIDILCILDLLVGLWMCVAPGLMVELIYPSLAHLELSLFLIYFGGFRVGRSLISLIDGRRKAERVWLLWMSMIPAELSVIYALCDFEWDAHQRAVSWHILHVCFSVLVSVFLGKKRY